MSRRGKLLVVSDWLINWSLKFYSSIAFPFAKGGQLLKRFSLFARSAKLGVFLLAILLLVARTLIRKLCCSLDECTIKEISKSFPDWASFSTLAFQTV